MEIILQKHHTEVVLMVSLWELELWEVVAETCACVWTLAHSGC